MKNFKVLILSLIAFSALSLTLNVWLAKESLSQSSQSAVGNSVSSLLAEPVLAEDIYPMFFCPCCGQPLDKNNICCGLAKERIDYIDSLTVQNLSKKEIILAYVKKYGLNFFTDEEKQNEARGWLVESAPAVRPIISLNQNYYDFGDISQKGGVVFTYFEIKNEGKKDLVIDRLDSSCGCTSAAIVFQGVEGPRFAMAGHGIENPTDWKVTITPGAQAKLMVYYDPDVHKDFRGPAVREISVFSNDPIDFEKKVTIDLNQTD